MKVIDFHTHVFPDEIASRALSKVVPQTPLRTSFTDGTVGGLLRSMDHCDIAVSVTLPVATKESQVSVINEACTDMRSERIVPFGALYPGMESFAPEIELLCERGVGGVKLHPEHQGFYFDSPAMFPVYELLEEKGFVLVVHAGKAPGAFGNDHGLPHALRTVHQQFPSLALVATHMGGLHVWDDVETELVGLPIYLDTAAVSNYMDESRFLRIARAHGMDRILFGTDSPWYDQTKEKEWIERLALTDGDRLAIFHDNAARILGMT